MYASWVVFSWGNVLRARSHQKVLGRLVAQAAPSGISGDHDGTDADKNTV